ncbi:MAG: S-methyl-5-thioribose-1-phosphate isomerase [Pirellulaceae bacterium]
MSIANRPETLRWEGSAAGRLYLLDQTLLPAVCEELCCADIETLWEAIRSLRVRGAPAIGIAAAYGVCLGVQCGWQNEAGFFSRLNEVVDYLASSRPTAVNLFWALERMRNLALRLRGQCGVEQLPERLLVEARAIHDEDRATCHAIGRWGATLLESVDGVLTHCNAGGLATAEYGTALAVFYTCQDQGRRLQVYVDETRPLLQGARLTAWELSQRGISTTLICDSMAAQVMKEGRVQAVLVGADRIAANGDTANKIGTYSLAVLARAHGIPFYVAAPVNTFDLTLASGDSIPIEQRAASEITAGFGRITAPPGIDVYNPAFDVTPGTLIRAIVTERGVIAPVGADTIRTVLNS